MIYLLLQEEMAFLFILLLVSIVPPLLFLMQRKHAVRVRKLPPGPTRLPIIGNLHQLTDMPHLSLERLSNKYGPLMFLQLGSKPALVISSADMVREIFKTCDLAFSGRPVLYAAEKISYGCCDVTFAPYSEYWKEIRKICVLELLSAKKVQSFRTEREEEVALLIASIASSHGPIDLSQTLLHLVNDVVCRVVFGRKYLEANNKSEFHKMLGEIQELAGGFSVADFFPWLGWIHKFDGLKAKLDKNLRQLDEFYDQVIEEHLDPKRPKPQVEDFIDTLLRVQRDPSQRISLSRDQIKGILTDMFIAGTDTSSATLIWTMTELIKNPTLMKKAQEEVRQVVGKKDIVEESDLPRLSYLNLVLKESIRLHPPAPLLVPRETTQNCTVRGYEIPAKTRVYINAKTIATDQRSWENPEEFWPERFLDNPIDFRGLHYEFIPFGLGRRICPGISFGLVLIEIVLANLLHCFNWELPQGVEREDVDMKEAFGIAMHKKVPLCLVARSAIL